MLPDSRRAGDLSARLQSRTRPCYEARMSTAERIEAALRAAFAPEALSLVDESHLHAGHAGARGGGGHFRVRIVSARFAGMGLVARHRAVYACLADEMRGAVHALALTTLAPGEPEVSP